MQPRQIVSAYFAFQAIGVLVWWALLVGYPESVNWFQPKAWPAGSLLSFWLADVLLIVGGSSVVAVGVWSERAWATSAVWTVAVVCWYPTLVCLAASLRTGEAWIASSMMASMAGLSLAMATIRGNLGQSPAAIRVTRMKRRTALLWTFGQLVIFWGTFLWLLPMGIVELQDYLGWDTFRHPLQAICSATLFLLASCLGLWSAVAMVTHGHGTPLPTATAPRLVIAGPYRYVRNPMAVAGILQGIAVGWFLGSFPVIAYSLIGIALWHVIVRPVEERELLDRFGDNYQQYRSRVWVWIPTTAPFEPDESSW